MKKQDILLNLIEENEIKIQSDPSTVFKVIKYIITFFTSIGITITSVGMIGMFVPGLLTVINNIDAIKKYLKDDAGELISKAVMTNYLTNSSILQSYSLIILLLAMSIGLISSFVMLRLFDRKIITKKSLDELEEQLKYINIGIKNTASGSSTFKQLVKTKSSILDGIRNVFEELKLNDDPSKLEFKAKLKKILMENI